LIENVEKQLKGSIEKKQKDLLCGSLFFLHGVIFFFFFLCIILGAKEIHEKNINNSDTTSHANILTSFIPGIVTRAAVLGDPLLLRSAHLPSSSVLERINSLLEEPRSLVLSEDTQGLFNNPRILLKITGDYVRSIPISSSFTIAATTTETGYLGLSAPLQSRFTYISAPEYSPAGYSKLGMSITQNKNDLMSSIELLYGYLYKLRIKLTVVEYVRWCRSVIKLHNDLKLSCPHSAAVALLRSFVDFLPFNQRCVVIKEALLPFMEGHQQGDILAELFSIILPIKAETKDECPLYLEENLMKSTLSGVFVPVFDEGDMKYLKDVIWTNSAKDIADAVLTAVASGAVAVFEGSPGRGKVFCYLYCFIVFQTMIAQAVLMALGYSCKRLNFSPASTVEDVFGRDLPRSTEVECFL
jgi:midasin (ATPase involved in ribosome maturation)